MIVRSSFKDELLHPRCFLVGRLGRQLSPGLEEWEGEKVRRTEEGGGVLNERGEYFGRTATRQVKWLGTKVIQSISHHSPEK